MYFLETIARLVLLFAKAISMVSIKAANIIFAVRTIFFAIWVAVTLVINVFWFVKVTLKKQLILPILHLTLINFLFIATFVQIEWLFNVNIIFHGADVVCKLLIWIQTACITARSGLIIYIIKVFQQPQSLQSKIKKNILIIYLISTTLTLPQALQYETNVVDSDNHIVCSLGPPDVHNNFFASIKPLLSSVIFAVLLASQVFLYKIFQGTPEQFLRRGVEIKWIEIETYCVAQQHAWTYYLVLSTILYFFPILKNLVECFHISLILSGCLFSTFSPYILTRILDKIPCEEIPPNRKFRRITPSSSSSYDTVSVELIDNDENVLPDAERNLNKNAAFP